MAVAEIIGAAIGILLLVIVAYLIVGGTLSVAETVATAQKDLTLQNEARLRTNLDIDRTDIDRTGSTLNFSITNTGNEIVSDFDHMDVFTYDGSLSGYQHYTYDSYNLGKTGNWSLIRIETDIIHPNQLDPGEKAWIWATYSGDAPIWVQVTTRNGVYAQTTIP